MGKNGKVEGAAMGIDLGSSCAVVGIWENDRVEIIPNDRGKRTTPSCVAFSGTEYMVGDAAKEQAASNPTNTISNVDLLIGRKYSQLVGPLDPQNFPYTIVNRDGRPSIQVDFKGERRNFFPEEILAMLLIKMKKSAESYLGKAVPNVVLSHPESFNDTQRGAMADACLIAGLNVLYIPGAAIYGALGHYVEHACVEHMKNVLVFDLGCNHLSVTLFAIEEDIYEIKAKAYDDTAGVGSQFDRRVCNALVDEFKGKARPLSKPGCRPTAPEVNHARPRAAAHRALPATPSIPFHSIRRTPPSPLAPWPACSGPASRPSACSLRQARRRSSSMGSLTASTFSRRSLVHASRSSTRTCSAQL